MFHTYLKKKLIELDHEVQRYGSFYGHILLITASSGRKSSCINLKTAQPIDTEFGVPMHVQV